MSKPVYRLQIVLDQKDRAKKDAAEALVAAQKALRAEEALLAKKEEERREVDRKRERVASEFQAALMKPGCQISEEADRHDHFQKVLDGEAARIDAEIQKQRTAVRRAEQRVEDARAALTRAAMELQAMEKHKENWQKQVKREADDKEQRQQEEVGEVMWLAERRKAQQDSRGGEA